MFLMSQIIPNLSPTLLLPSSSTLFCQGQDLRDVQLLVDIMMVREMMPDGSMEAQRFDWIQKMLPA